MPPQVIMLRTSERTAFKRCRQMWWWAYVDHLKPVFESTPLRFGTLVHRALEARYPLGTKRGPHPAKTFEILYDEELMTQEAMGFRDEDGKWHDARELGIDMLNAYVNEYGEDEEWEVMSSELPFQVEIHRTKKYVVMYTGIIDGVWRNRITEELWLNDYKTAKSIDVTNLPRNEQATSYWGFAPIFLRQQGILGPEEKLKGIIFTYLRKALQDSRPTDSLGRRLNSPTKQNLLDYYEANERPLPDGSGRGGAVKVDDLLADLGEAAELLGEVSKNQPAPYFVRQPTRRNEVQAQRVWKRALGEAKEMMLARQGKLMVDKTFSDLHCGFCPFRDMCELHEAGQDWEEFRDQTMRVWSPYSEHEIEKAELT